MAALSKKLAAILALACTASVAHAAIFSYTGNTQTYIVPDGVTEIQVSLWGGGGGAGGYPGLGSLASGNAGAYVTGDLSVTPGSTLIISVGGGGIFPATGSGGGAGGFGGGGQGGSAGIGGVSGFNGLSFGGNGGAGGGFNGGSAGTNGSAGNATNGNGGNGTNGGSAGSLLTFLSNSGNSAVSGNTSSVGTSDPDAISGSLGMGGDFSNGQGGEVAIEVVSSTPEPASLGLMGVGGMLLLRRRRR